MIDWIDDLDRSIVERVQSLRWGSLDDVFRWLSSLPLRLALVLGALLLISLAARSVRPAVACAVAVSVTLALTTALQQLTDRPRPPEVDRAIHPLVSVPGNPSFPSGHASTAFAAAAALAPFASARWRPALYVLAGLVALSRVWLGVHYPTDVIAGALLGFAIGALVARLLPRRRAGARAVV